MANTKQKINILVAGPANSGKSTFLNTLSMTPIVNAENRPAETVREFEFPGSVEIGEFLTPDLQVELRALPCAVLGSEVFDANWNVAGETADAVLLMVPADDPQSFLEALRILDCVKQRLDVPFLVALTRNDEGLIWEKADVSDCFEIPEDFITYLDPRDYQDAFDSLNCLFELVPTGGHEIVEEVAVRAIA